MTSRPAAAQQLSVPFIDRPVHEMWSILYYTDQYTPERRFVGRTRPGLPTQQRLEDHLVGTWRMRRLTVKPVGEAMQFKNRIRTFYCFAYRLEYLITDKSSHVTLLVVSSVRLGQVRVP